MNIWQKKRLIGIVFGLITSCLMWFILSMMGSRINVYLTPSELKQRIQVTLIESIALVASSKRIITLIDKDRLRFEFTIIDSGDELVLSIRVSHQFI